MRSRGLLPDGRRSERLCAIIASRRAPVKTLFPFAALFGAVACLGQDPLALNQPAARDLEPGTTQSYSIRLNTGDYVTGVLDQQNVRVDAVRVYSPDGEKLREFQTPPTGKLNFAFVAEHSGTHRLDIRQDKGSAAAKYALTLTERLSVDERLRPTLPTDKYSSPRIEALRKQIASGPKDTSEFWRQVAAEGTPL